MGVAGSRSLLVAAAALCGLIGGALAAPVSAGRHRLDRCASARSRSVIATRSLRVYRTPRVTGASTGALIDTVYACWRATGRKRKLVAESNRGPHPVGNYDVSNLGAVKLASGAANVIAFTERDDILFGDTPSFTSVTSLDVRTGKTIRDNSADLNCDMCGADILEFVVTANGSLGWIGTGPSCANKGVVTIGEDGHERTVECPVAGAPSFPDGLTFTGGMLSWHTGTTPHSVPFA